MYAKLHLMGHFTNNRVNQNCCEITLMDGISVSVFMNFITSVFLRKIEITRIFMLINIHTNFVDS